MARVTESDILRQMAVREEPGVYVLGCFERRITLYTQQVRALNLIHSLFVEERLKEGAKLAVIGGGAAGLTAAAGAAIRGAKVTVFEQASDLLAMFRNNRQRWLHPHLYDWPEEGSEEPQANLPVLDWTADLAGNVAERLLAQWQPLVQRHGIEVHTRVRRLQIHPGSSTPRQLAWNTDSFDEGDFDTVILAVGFGTERTLEGAPSRSYWEDDNLDRLLHASGTSKRYLISGTGDGGLIDLLRVRLRDFRHERIIQRYLGETSLGAVRTELLTLEEEFRQERLQERDFFKKYKELPVPKELDERLREDLRGDTTAVLNGRDVFPLSAGASILNRFLTSRLMRLGGVRYESGTLSVKRAEKTESYAASFLDENKHPKHVEEFDDIIVRHGPEPALERSFDSIWKKAGARMRELAELDQTRRPLFRAEDFAKAPSGARPRTPAAPVNRSTPTAAPSRGDCFGREELTRQLVEEVLAEEPRPTMVLGPPGIGKSTLTRQAYHHPEVARRYGNRRYFVRLDGATSREWVVSAVAAVLGIGSEPRLWDAVKHSLQAAPALLVLDNLETPWHEDRSGTEALLAELGAVAGLALVGSVRGGERPYVPRGRPPLEVTRLDDTSALDLFCSIASKVDRKEPLLESLLRAQEGLPLAIKLLAFAAEGASLENTWALWRTERAALYERPGGSDRESSLSVSLEVSIKGPRMTNEARRLLSLLALLPGGVAQGDLERLLPGVAHGAAQVLAKVGLAFFEQGRIRMLAPIREYVRRLRPPGAEERERVLNHYLGVSREHGGRLGRMGGGEASMLLMTEFANIEGLIEEELDGKKATDAMDAAIALSEFMRFSGHGTSRVLQRASAVARLKGEAGREANCIQSLGDIALVRSQHEEARRRYEEALPLFEQEGDVQGRANCIRSLGDIALARSPHEARDLFEQALSLYMLIPEPYSIGQTHRRLARIAPSAEARRRHIIAARQAWESIDRPDLVQELHDELGDG
ncbi:MAG TPA: tetratricopeptide repeat protein [Archangium sp.]|uniref:tetratricopeptide repeat protein n=1 Tax=Archangium sp. TaxID=1872627 RepID=UPI002E334E20|nr:tetratricopeptide repeat protein [Archangium sp.]HEX5750884.1 tetratricopeptide repeat protein [Archangium sp.]